MTETTSTTGTIESRDDLPGKDSDAREFEYWMRQTDIADKEDKEFRRWAIRAYMLIQLNAVWYHYCGIDKGMVSQLISAASVGRYYNQTIKGSSIAA
jgi:hypothetical protein